MSTFDEKSFRVLLAIFLLLVVVGGLVDLIVDHRDHTLSPHILFEIFTILTAAAMAALVWSGWWRSERSVRALRDTLEIRAQERDAWRSSARRALDGLAEAIDTAFQSWGLTPAERSVALLLMKGHSHKQIAQESGRSERTIRQHAGTIYQKAGLSSRAQLSAYFLQDLILPEPEREVIQQRQVAR